MTMTQKERMIYELELGIKDIESNPKLNTWIEISLNDAVYLLRVLKSLQSSKKKRIRRTLNSNFPHPLMRIF